MQSGIQTSRLSRLLAIILLLTLISAPALGAASGPASEPGPEAGRQSAPVSEPGLQPSYNDCALFIAGISNPQGPLAPCENKPAWRRYAKFIDQSWKRFDSKHLAPMQEWASRELTTVKTGAVFYPFSGPDFVNLYTLFPDARVYLMVALEPVGAIPDLAAAPENHFFGSLQTSLYDLLQLNFFITEKLNVSLEQPELQGILPILLFFLAREKAQILDVRQWVMKPDGTIAESPAADRRRPGRGGVNGVRIDFTRAGTGEKQTLFYFRFNLRNDSLERHEKFVSFLKGFGPFTTFAKAASYLMHKPGFSKIRQFILDQSNYVLQGDSAIPVKYFEPGAWNLRFFGTYTRPINLFQKYQQTDLAELYKEGTAVAPLPFGIDYRHRLNTSNLMFASKKMEMPAVLSK